MSHVGKARAKLVLIWTNQRITAQHIDMIGDEHDIARIKIRVEPAGRVGHYQRTHPQRVHHAHRKDDQGHGVALVIMKAAPHHHDLFPCQGTQDKLARVSGHRRDREPGNLAVRKNGVYLNVIGQSAKMAPADRRLYALRDVTATVESLPLYGMATRIFATLSPHVYRYH